MTNETKVLALKYRPQTFEDLVGQEEIAKTISNSIKINKVSNAYLFTGIRGVGKTTFARIVAKALNCEKGIDKFCSENFCSNCTSIINSNHIDILEIDAASNTGVDNIRELLEFSRYSPTIAKFKVFIIDEVHMLSKQAFNALLKTLEEPPKYLKFIFATTEVKKIPITIISRCQRFDLSRVKAKQLFEYIKEIANKEKIKIEADAIKLIVKISEGSVRDALSLLDRTSISNNRNILTFENAQKIFGFTNKSSYIDLLEYVFKGDEKNVLNHYRKIYNDGVEPNNFLNEFLEVLYYLKNISYINIDGRSFSLNDSDYKKILYLSKNIHHKDILLFWELTLKTMKEIYIVSNPNLSIEMFLVQLLHLKKNNNLKPVTNNPKFKKNESIKTENHNKIDLISQIKNTTQEEEKIEKENTEKIESLADLIDLCLKKKEMNLKYDLENNVNLVSFSFKKIEISFNEKLNKNFVKDLSEKLFEWTKTRWIILFSKDEGEMTKKQQNKNFGEKRIQSLKQTDFYKDLLKNLPDIELIDLKKNND